MWTESEFNAFNEFIRNLLYEKMSNSDYELIMSELGAKKRGDRYTTICHNIDGGGYNLAYNEEYKTFTCFSECGCSYSLLSLIKQRRKLLNLPCSTYQSMKWLCERLGVPFDFKEQKEIKTNIYNWKSLLKYTKEYKDNVNEPYSKYVLNCLEDCVYKPWLEEGINENTQNKYQIKWYERTQQVVIPIFNINGEFVGTQCRNTNPQLVDMGLKYDHLRLLNGEEYKFHMGSELFGLNYNWVNIQRCKEVTLLEAPKSVMQMDCFSIPNVGVAMFGMNFSLTKLKLLLNLGVETFNIALDRQYLTTNDNDVEFDKYKEKVNKIINIIKPYAKNINVIWDSECNILDYKDSPTDKGEETYIKLLSNAERI